VAQKLQIGDGIPVVLKYLHHKQMYTLEDGAFRGSGRSACG